MLYQQRPLSFCARHVPIATSVCCSRTHPKRHVTSLDAATCSVKTWALTANRMRMGATGNSVMAALGVMKGLGPVSKAWLPPSLKTTIMSSLEHQGRTTGKVEMIFLCVLVTHRSLFWPLAWSYLMNTSYCYHLFIMIHKNRVFTYISYAFICFAFLMYSDPTGEVEHCNVSHSLFPFSLNFIALWKRYTF